MDWMMRAATLSAALIASTASQQAPQLTARFHLDALSAQRGAIVLEVKSLTIGGIVVTGDKVTYDGETVRAEGNVEARTVR
jgi:hypothetical protein